MSKLAEELLYGHGNAALTVNLRSAAVGLHRSLDIGIVCREERCCQRRLLHLPPCLCTTAAGTAVGTAALLLLVGSKC